MTRAQQAKENFLHGLNCSQAVAMAFADLLDVPEGTLKAALLPLGGGMGRLRETCGTVSGAAVTLGLLFPGMTKPEMYALVQELARRFRAKNGSINCGQLLSGAGLPVDTSPNPEARTEAYYKKLPFPDLVYDAAEIVEALCMEKGRI